MVYISIGSACNVKYQINKHKHIHKSETLFFDWLMTSMISVIEILSCDNIDNILFFDNIIIDSSKTKNANTRVIIKSLNHCVSIHDIINDFSDEAILNFIDKYKRRFERIIEYIKSDEHIYFIRASNIDNEIQQKFIETILNINPKCNFTLIVIDNNKKNDTNIFKDKNLLYIKLNIEASNTKPDWETNFLNWEKIFLDIENNI